MKKLDEADERLVSRLVDGDLDSARRAELERRMLREPALREAIESQREVRAWFSGLRGDGRPSKDGGLPAKGFAGRVLAAVQELPPRDALHEAGVLGEVEAEIAVVLHFGRRILAAAVLVFGLALLVTSGWLRPSSQDRLEAADAQRIREIDAAILKAATHPEARTR